jgi:hypothetical protein
MLTLRTPRLLLAAIPVAVLTAGALAQTQPTQAGVLTSVTATDIANILKAEGYQATVQAVQGGKDPGEYVSVKLAGKNVVVDLYDCKGKVCQTAELAAGFDLDTAPDLAKINEFNSNFLFTRLYTVKEDNVDVLWLESDLRFSGGITTDAVAEWISIYASNLDEFLGEFDLR